MFYPTTTTLNERSEFFSTCMQTQTPAPSIQYLFCFIFKNNIDPLYFKNSSNCEWWVKSYETVLYNSMVNSDFCILCIKDIISIYQIKIFSAHKIDISTIKSKGLAQSNNAWKQTNYVKISGIFPETSSVWWSAWYKINKHCIFLVYCICDFKLQTLIFIWSAIFCTKDISR